MNTLIKELIRLSDKLTSPETSVDKKYKVLIAIKEFDISLADVSASKLGKAVKKCSNLSGKAGLLAQKLVNKWKKMFDDYSNEIQDDGYEESNNENKKSKYNRSDNIDSKPIKHEISQRRNKDSDSDNSYQTDASDDSETKFVSSLSKMPENSSNRFRKNEDYFEKSQKNTKYTVKDFSSDSSFDDNDDDGDYFQSNIENNYVSNKAEKIEKSSHHPKTEERNNSKPIKRDAKSPESLPFLKPQKKSELPIAKSSKPPKSRKSDSKHISTFEDFLVESASAQQSSESSSHHGASTNKRKSLSSLAPENSGKKPKLAAPISSSSSNMDLLSTEGGPALPTLSRSDTKVSYIKTQINNHKVDKEALEDVDCTSKYSSERKIWVPTRKTETQEQESVPEDVRMIGGVSEHVIAQYDYQKLLAFEGDNRKLMRQTESFWEKLFNKVHKTQHRRDHESWRDAFLRAQRDNDLRLKELSERVRRNNEEKIQAVNKAKLLSCVPMGKGGHRRMTDMRR